MKIISWNVNGLLSRIQNGFWEFVDEHQPDVLCLQETKADESQVPLSMDLITRGYDIYWNGGKKRKNGVATLISNDQFTIHNLDINKFNGRVIVTENENVIIVNVYSPMSGSGFINLEDRLGWDTEFQNLIKRLKKEKPIIICGDLNVAHRSYLEGKKANLKSSPGFSDEEWNSHQKLLNLGLSDILEEYGMGSANSSDVEIHTHSWRLDYILLSTELKSNIDSSFSIGKLYGSDHYPIGINLDI